MPLNPFSENAQKCSEVILGSEHSSKTSKKKSGPSIRSRGWCGTTNNYTKEIDWSQLQLLGDYGCVAEEVAPSTGTPHLQWYLYFENKISFNSLKKKLPRSHIEIAKGTSQENRTYIFGPYDKDGKHKDANPTAIEWGEIPQQGKRTDLDLIKDDIMKGKPVDDICIESPILYHQYGRTLEKIEDIALRKKYRTEMTQGIWYWGKTGVGKSHKAFDGFDTEHTYNYPIHDNGWWDGYKQQATVVINEFRGEIKFNELLVLVDKWPHSVKRRCREPMPFTSNLVIITSACPPEEIYRNSLSDNDKMEQFHRRFNVIHLT